MTFADLHLHVLPGVDDGPENLPESLGLLKGLCDLGFTTLVPTFHLDVDHEDRPALVPGVFRNLAAAAGDLKPLLLPGFSAEHRIDALFFRSFSADRLLTYPGSRFVLVEGGLGPAGLPPNLSEILFRLQVKGLRPILAHPERYDAIQTSPALAAALREAGTWMQLDLLSLESSYGREAQRTARKLLEREAYDLAASDIHHLRDLEVLGRALHGLEAAAGPAGLARLLSEGPAEVLDQDSRERTPR